MYPRGATLDAAPPAAAVLATGRFLHPAQCLVCAHCATVLLTNIDSCFAKTWTGVLRSESHFFQRPRRAK